MSFFVPPICLLTFTFRVTSPINNLPQFHGPHISALMRNLFRFLPGERLSMSAALITIQPIESGVINFEEGDSFNLGVAFPINQAKAIKKLAEGFNGLSVPLHGRFVPGKTILLEKVTCRLTGKIWKPDDTEALSLEHIQREIRLLTELEEFSLLFYTPLRLTKPQGKKASGRKYCDEEYFLGSTDEHSPLAHLINSINKRISKYFGNECSADKYAITDIDCDFPQPEITDGALMWLDCPYGFEPAKTIGGVTGRVRFKGRCSEGVAQALVTGQYTGIGKNTAFGFGFYTIPELDGAKDIVPPTRCKTILERSMDIEYLKEALSKLPPSSPGADGIAVSDAKKAGSTYLETLRNAVLSERHVQGELKRFRLPKQDGRFRDIYVQCVSDRLIHKAIADFLLPVVDGLLHRSSYAYRRGLNRKGAAEALKKAFSEGYSSGIKADIASFFDSVNLDKLFLLLEGIFPFDPVTSKIKKLIDHFTTRGIRGLPQGSPLSPVLSNLYLDRFDRDIEKEGLRLVRYSDDFVILTKDGITSTEIVEKIRKSLTRLDLSLKEEKLMEVKKELPIKFLGYLISEEGITDEVMEKDADEKEWFPVFRDEWVDGYPVYLTTLSKGAFSSGADLVIKSDDEKTEKIPWNRISRLVIVGRSPVSGGLIYRAVKEEIPVTFIDILGRTKGNLYPEYKEAPDLLSLHSQYANDNTFSLTFAQEIISAKIHNSIVLLRRNLIESKELKELEKKSLSAESLDSLRGYEGTAARIYFSEFAHLVEPFEFKGRVYHPPDCPVNVMLSLGYTMLYNRIASMLKDKGFNARMGFYHKGRGAHNALASDLMEELRHIVERIVLSLIHLKEITGSDFSMIKRKNVDVCRMEGEGFRKYVRRFEKSMAQKASYHGSEKMSYNAYLDEMAGNLKRSFKLNIPYKALRID